MKDLGPLVPFWHAKQMCNCAYVAICLNDISEATGTISMKLCRKHLLWVGIIIHAKLKDFGSPGRVDICIGVSINIFLKQHFGTYEANFNETWQKVPPICTEYMNRLYK